jgi:hypothetical protein
MVACDGFAFPEPVRWAGYGSRAAAAERTTAPNRTTTCAGPAIGTRGRTARLERRAGRPLVIGRFSHAAAAGCGSWREGGDHLLTAPLGHKPSRRPSQQLPQQAQRFCTLARLIAAEGEEAPPVGARSAVHARNRLGSTIRRFSTIRSKPSSMSGMLLVICRPLPIVGQKIRNSAQSCRAAATRRAATPPSRDSRAR